MRSVLFLIACSFCAACNVFASEVIEIETQQPTVFTEIEETQAITCNKCKRPSCPGCGTLACSKCRSHILACKDCGCTCTKEISEEGLIASKKNRRTAVIACSCSKRKKSKSLQNVLACDEETVEIQQQVA